MVVVDADAEHGGVVPSPLVAVQTRHADDPAVALGNNNRVVLRQAFEPLAGLLRG
ncbi:hypothetical protein D3C85_1834980 [compost metagenome]